MKKHKHRAKIYLEHTRQSYGSTVPHYSVYKGVDLRGVFIYSNRSSQNKAFTKANKLHTKLLKRNK